MSLGMRGSTSETLGSFGFLETVAWRRGRNMEQEWSKIADPS
jgi:hypothetical protein